MFEQETQPELGDEPVAAVPPGHPEVERLDPRVVPYWLISNFVSMLFLAGIGAGVFLAFREELLGDWFWAFLAGSVLFSVWLLWSVVEPSLAYRRWRFTIDEELMLMRFGIIFHAEKAIPISRMQHVDLTRGPIERLFGLATLVVFTAGTEAASFRLPGVAVGRAHELRDQILIARGDDVI